MQSSLCEVSQPRCRDVCRSSQRSAAPRGCGRPGPPTAWEPLGPPHPSPGTSPAPQTHLLELPATGRLLQPDSDCPGHLGRACCQPGGGNLGRGWVWEACGCARGCDRPRRTVAGADPELPFVNSSARRRKAAGPAPGVGDGCGPAAKQRAWRVVG